ncbi:MAG: four helix bundle protein [Ignavibacteriales bacterium]|nr:four helix bundle protein [Ignavibacteriales bacterium]
MQTNNNKQNTNSKPIYDLEERLLQFAKKVRLFVRKIKVDELNKPDMIQLIKSSGSEGANYIEANESLSKKDFMLRMKISRKEAKESIFWLRILEIYVGKENFEEYIEILNEAIELKKILSSIIEKSK